MLHHSHHVLLRLRVSLCICVALVFLSWILHFPSTEAKSYGKSPVKTKQVHGREDADYLQHPKRRARVGAARPQPNKAYNKHGGPPRQKNGGKKHYEEKFEYEEEEEEPHPRDKDDYYKQQGTTHHIIGPSSGILVLTVPSDTDSTGHYQPKQRAIVPDHGYYGQGQQQQLGYASSGATRQQVMYQPASYNYGNMAQQQPTILTRSAGLNYYTAPQQHQQLQTQQVPVVSAPRFMTIANGYQQQSLQQPVVRSLYPSGTTNGFYGNVVMPAARAGSVMTGDGNVYSTSVMASPVMNSRTSASTGSSSRSQVSSVPSNSGIIDTLGDDYADDDDFFSDNGLTNVASTSSVNQGSQSSLISASSHYPTTSGFSVGGLTGVASGGAHSVSSRQPINSRTLLQNGGLRTVTTNNGGVFGDTYIAASG